MTVLTTSWKAEYTGDGSTTTFLCAFPLMQVKDLLVYVDDVLMRASRDYTLSGVVETDRHTVAAGFSVVMTEAPASGAEVYIRRKTPRENQTVLHGGDKFSLPVFENNYDRLVMIFQEIGGLILEGFQGPVPEIAQRPDYEPQSSGFFPAKVIAGPSLGLYTLRAAIPSELGWSTTALPLLTEQGAEINGRTDISVGDVVLVLPIADTQGQDGWRFVANEPCGEVGGTPYTGDYFVIARCDNETVDEVAWVRDDEFNVGDVFMLDGVCYAVQAGIVASAPAALTVRLADTTSYADCTACQAAMPDPDAPQTPFPANRYRDMALCSDDSTDQYSLPVEFFGIPTNHDLTKIYQDEEDQCFYVSEIETGTPNNPLFPVHTASLYNNCLACGCGLSSTHICVNCDDTPSSQPSVFSVVFSGINLCPCFTSGGQDIELEFVAGFLLNNTVHTLTESGPCLWAVNYLSPSFSRSIYGTSDGSCGGAGSDGSAGFSVYVSLERTATQWVLRVRILATGGFLWYNLFTSTVDAITSDGDELCSVLPSFTNTLGACVNPDSDQIGGTGGGATVTCG